MYRTNTCGELRLTDAGREVTLAGWVQRTRKMGGMTFVDLRDRYGLTQLVFDESKDAQLCERANKLGREFCVQVTGTVSERQSKNPKMPTGDIEILASGLNILSESLTPPFTIEDQTDGGDDIRMKYRYLDLRRSCVRKNLELRHRMTILIRNFLDNLNFIEVETPILIGSTPEGARDFVVPSRMNPGQFYALPQSPQTLKQLLMVSGFDRYFQIAKCFRDEDLRADRQPEFTQIDCEMSFADQEDVLEIFEGLARHLFKEVRGVELPPLQRMTWHEAMRRFGSDKPDLRFGMEFVELMDVLKGTGTFPVFNDAQYIGGICVPGCADYTRKQLDQLTDFVKRPQVGAKGLVYVKFNADGTVKSSIDKFYAPEVWQQLKAAMGANDGDLVLIMSGDQPNKTRVQLCTLRLEMGERLGLRDKDKFVCLWIVDFPLFEWSDEEQRLMATHHPFTLPNPDDIPLLDTAPEKSSRRSLRLRLQRRRGGRWLTPYTRRQTAGKNVPDSRLHPREGNGTVRFPHQRLQVRRTPSCRSRLRSRSLRVAHGGARQHPRLHSLPEEQLRPRRHARCSRRTGPEAAGRAEPESGDGRERISPLKATLG